MCTVTNLVGRNAGYSNRIFDWALFSSPSGIAAAPDGSRVYVADTNNHALRLLDMQMRK
jgi:DNA-binding beta-propeller fold protein YncE